MSKDAEQRPASPCSSCGKPKASTQCEACEADLCKGCVKFLEPTSFGFLTQKPAELMHTRYCEDCYAESVEPAETKYEETMELAKAVYVFFKTQKRRPPILKKSKHVLRVDKNPDRDETILKLAFQAAELGYNALVDTEVVSEKIKDEAYSKLSWRGSALAVEVDGSRLDREAYREDRF